MDETSRVLRNKGVTVRFGDEEVEFALTCGAIADLEEAFDGVGEWQAALQKRPASTARKTMAIVLSRDEADLASQMDQPLIDYVAAISVAWGVANGLDPTKAAEAMKAAREGSASVVESLLTDDSPGEPGKQPG